jgi:hypothetical protein
MIYFVKCPVLVKGSMNDCAAVALDTPAISCQYTIRAESRIPAVSPNEYLSDLYQLRVYTKYVSVL